MTTSGDTTVDKDFDGMVAVVTGGASGIGLATVRRLAERGARVGALDLTPDSLDRPESVLPLRCDVRDQASVDAAIDTVVATFGQLDICVNNAGIGAVGTVTDNTDDEWHRVLDVNVVGIARMSRAALPHLRRSPTGVIVNTCSVAATAGLVQRAVYSASKGAVQALTFAMAADLLSEGIRVCCVNPGTADTPWVQQRLAETDDPDAALASLKARQPMGRLASAAEIADAICFLANARSAFTTGIALAVDGGMAGVRLVR